MPPDVQQLRDLYETERERLGAENSRMSRQIAAFREQQCMLTLHHELQLSGWMHDHDMAESARVEAEQENIILREQLREMEKLREDRDRTEARNVVLEARLDRHRELRTEMRRLFLHQQLESNSDDWGLNKMSIRNFPSSAAENPQPKCASFCASCRCPWKETFSEWYGTVWS